MVATLVQHNGPQVLVIEDSPRCQALAHTLLTERGVPVRAASTLLDGLQAAEAMLDPRLPARPTLLLVDLMLPHERSMHLESTLLLAYLGEQMEHHHLHPAHMVAITAMPTQQRQDECWVAGCSHCLDKPLDPQKAAFLADLARTHAPLPQPLPVTDPLTPLRAALRRAAVQVLDFVRSDAAYGYRQTEVPLVAWDDQLTEALLFAPETLRLHLPIDRWLEGHGGRELVLHQLYQRLLHTDARPEVARLLQLLLLTGTTDRESLQARLGVSKATFYRHRHDLVQRLTALLGADGAA